VDPDKTTPLILRIGGSVISHSNKVIDFDYLRELRDLLQEKILMGKRFVLVLGGGQRFQELLTHVRENGNITDTEAQHWIGTAVNTVHAYVVRGFLGDDLAEKRVWKFDDIDKISELSFSKPVVVTGGFKAGMSSDGVALQIAKALNGDEIYDLKNIDGVYNEDPRENPKAKRYPELSWDDYLEIIGNPEEHEPGANLPVDVIAAREAKELNIKYYVMKASDFDNLDKALANEEFTGTIIS
jgi:predicted uridylate kinase